MHSRERMAKKQPILIEPGTKVKLKNFDPGYTGDYGNDKDEAKDELENLKEKMAKLQNLLYAEDKHALLIVLQGMDACGKDGTIRTVMSGVNPQGCQVTSFKVPSDEERDHDFLWRIYKALPAKGNIGIFNRSHYEDVLVVRVHNLVAPEVWKERYEMINDFEKTLAKNGIVILKFFLHISKDEQAERFRERLQDPAKNWKFSTSDLKEREYWDLYQEAFEDAISKTSTKWAPWYIVPSNKKWFRNLVISKAIVETLEGLNMKFPEPPKNLPKPEMVV